MMKLSKDTVKDIYEYLQNKRGRIKRRSLLLAAFVLGVNIFAWFVFVSRANVTVNSNIIAWDVDFTDENSVINNVIVETDELYPGMSTYTKQIKVSNSSDLPATFTYEFESIKVMGEEVLASNATRETAISYLAETFPFIITFGSSKTELSESDNLTFNIKVDWPFEASDTGARDYYRLTSQYKYDPTVSYYSLSGSTYNKVEGVTEATFETSKTGYYLEKDDADSFWGANCQEYKDTYGMSCLSFKVVLKVTQKAQ